MKIQCISYMLTVKFQKNEKQFLLQLKQKRKYLGINKKCEGPTTENYKSLLKEIEKDPQN